MLRRVKSFLRQLGPGVITGASDDDPAGIVIYAQTGAQAGYKLLWTALLLSPFMIAVQEMCARIGIVTGRGLIGTMRKRYPPLLLWVIAVAVLLANIVNIGADLSAMAASTQLLVPIDTVLLGVGWAVLILVVIILFSYSALIKIFKWLTLSLFAYIFAAFVGSPDWSEILKSTFLPTLDFNRQTLLLLVAIMGTTISPYLFFWQSSEEAEDKKVQGKVDQRKSVQIVSKGEIRTMEHDVTFGMIFSNLVMYFIIATAASTLFKSGGSEIQSAEQAALALKPLAGEASFLLFSLGIIGTGLLAIPVLAGSGAYAVIEAMGRHEGLVGPIRKSKTFYSIIVGATLIGVSFTAFGIPPFRALFLTGVIYGILAPVLILIILNIANNQAIMGERTNKAITNILGAATFVFLSLAAIGAFVI